MEADLEAILDGTYQAPAYLEEHLDRRPRVSRRTALSVAGALTASAVAGVTVLGLGSGATPAEAATPKLLAYKSAGDGLSAQGRLAAIADRAAALPDTAGQGKYDHLRYQQWNEDTVVDGEQVTTAVIPQLVDMWVTADGEGKIVNGYGPPQFPDKAQEKAWKALGSPAPGWRRPPWSWAPGPGCGTTGRRRIRGRWRCGCDRGIRRATDRRRPSSRSPTWRRPRC
ncbi:hypothetical protein ACFQ9X_36400 [Catenulispora yoronensis]